MLPNHAGSDGRPVSRGIRRCPRDGHFSDSGPRAAIPNRKNLPRARKDGGPASGASVLARIGWQKKKLSERIAGALAEASDKSEFSSVFPRAGRPRPQFWRRESFPMIGKKVSNGWKIPGVFSNEWKVFSSSGILVEQEG
jgi:hypothetical protein